jgi:hypothetical protein
MIMRKVKLSFEEEVKYNHEIIIETDLSDEELEEAIDEINFDDANLQEGAARLEQNEEIKVIELIESDPCEWGMECTGIDDCKEEKESTPSE